MSCWVVPSVAAEFMGISIASVLEQARNGLIPSKTELGFTLLDVAPNSPTLKTGFRAPAAPPPTYRTSPSDHLTPAELHALQSDNSRDPELDPEELAALADAHSDADQRFDWRHARQLASRQRRAPRAAYAAA